MGSHPSSFRLPFLLDGLRNNWRCLYVGSPDVLQMVEQAGEDFTVIDVRNPNGWVQTATEIPEASRVPLDKLEERACSGCSVILVQKPQQHGYQDVWALQGGFQALQAAGLPVESKRQAA
jgi:rhodanese-related sulfurtransferase